ncbi:hypothetical protein D3C81_07510 [compost metagenome]
MAREYKYYGTYVHLGGEIVERLRKKVGYTGRNQFRLVCKAFSKADANRQAIALGLGEKLFDADSCETVNAEEIEYCDKFGMAVSNGGVHIYDGYSGVKELLSEKGV